MSAAEIKVGTDGVARREPEPDLDPAAARGDDALEAAEIKAPENVRGEFSSERAAEVAGEGLAGRLRARREQRRAEAKPREFPIPGWDGDLVVVARPYANRADIAKGVTGEKFIIGATKELRYRDEGGEWETIPGKWGQKLASMMGVEVNSASALVRAVFSEPVDGEWVENPLALDAFVMRMVDWMQGTQDELDADLGEG